MARTPAQQSSDLQTLVAKTNALQVPANSISIINGPLIIIGQGPYPTIIAGLSDIISVATSQLSANQGSPAVTDEKDANQLLADFTIVSRARRHRPHPRPLGTTTLD